jgi:hypothetical protein
MSDAVAVATKKSCQEPFSDLMLEEKDRHGLSPSMNFGTASVLIPSSDDLIHWLYSSR